MKLIVYAVVTRDGKLKHGQATYKRKHDAYKAAKAPGDSVVEAVIDLEAPPLFVKGEVIE